MNEATIKIERLIYIRPCQLESLKLFDVDNRLSVIKSKRETEVKRLIENRTVFHLNYLNSPIKELFQSYSFMHIYDSNPVKVVVNCLSFL